MKSRRKERNEGEQPDERIGKRVIGTRLEEEC